jgi:3-oxoacyl-[acyl-carrier protein] reductase
MNLGLEGRRALVGGATSGLGAAIARALADERADLLLWSRDETRLAAAAAELRDATRVRVETVAADATKPDASEVVLAAVRDAFGTVDIAVLNAGGPPPVDPLATTAEGWHEALQLLLLTPVEVASGLLPAMRDQGWGRIAAVLSSGIREPIPNLVYSNAGRSALASWLKTVSAAVAADGVTVNGVVPGRIATPRTEALDRGRAAADGTTTEEARRSSEESIPSRRYGTPEEFAAAVAFLVSDRAGYQTGSLVRVDGGLLRSD